MGRFSFFLFVSIFTYFIFISQAKAGCVLGDDGNCLTNSDGSNYQPAAPSAGPSEYTGYNPDRDSNADAIKEGNKPYQPSGSGSGSSTTQLSCNEDSDRADKVCSGNTISALAAAVAQATAGAAAGTAATANAAARAQFAQASTASVSTMTLGKQCYDVAADCVETCDGEAERSKSSNDSASAKRFKSKSNSCYAKKVAVLAQMGGSLVNLTAALANARAAGNPIDAPPMVPPPAMPSLTTASTSGTDAGPVNTPTDPAAFNGYDSKSGTAKYASNDANSSGGGASNAPYAPGGTPGGGGSGGGAASGFKDPGGGVNSGSGGGYSVSGVATTGGGGGGMGGGRGGSDKLDLSKFLPGGDMDPAKRGLASVEKQLQAQGITGANDLSNFEKVSRAMNRKRPAMKQ